MIQLGNLQKPRSRLCIFTQLHVSLHPQWNSAVSKYKNARTRIPGSWEVFMSGSQLWNPVKCLHLFLANFRDFQLPNPDAQIIEGQHL